MMRVPARSRRLWISTLSMGILVVGILLSAWTTADAHAEPDAEPVINCDASGYQRVAAGVALATADYMDDHTDVRDAYTDMKSDNVVPSDQANRYLQAHPDVAASMARLRQPLKDLMLRCGWGVPSN